VPSKNPVGGKDAQKKKRVITNRLYRQTEGIQYLRGSAQNGRNPEYCNEEEGEEKECGGGIRGHTRVIQFLKGGAWNRGVAYK